MMRHHTLGIIFTLGFVLAAITVPANASDRATVRPMISDNDTSATMYLARLQSDGRAYLQAPDGTGRPPSINMGDETPADDKSIKPKSPFRAFVYSAVVPGAGQLYTGSKTKAVLFLGLEALTWAGQIIYHNKGNDKTDAFNLFADTHWSQGRYEDFLEFNWDVRDDELVLNDIGDPYFTHHLPDTKTQQYYEMIGKYDQFVFGWDDIDTIATPPTAANITVAYSANREHYESMRHDANQMFDRSTAFLIATMANHLISGVEAALAARNYNKNMARKPQRLSFRADVAHLEDDYFPTLTMTYKF